MMLMPLPMLTDRTYDPAPGIWQTKQEARNLECTRISQAAAHELHPGRVPEPGPRTASGSLVEIDALTCTRRFLRQGERPARDEVILSSLHQSASEIAEVASALAPPDTTWHVDAFYPEPRVASKIAVATRTSLAEKGHKVSDRVPLLAAGDLAVMRELPSDRVYALACRRFFDQKILGANDAFLGVMIVDARETQLHAGVCLGGAWRWLQ